MSNRLPGLCYHKATDRYYVTLSGREFYLGSNKAAAKRERDRLVGEWLANGRQVPAALAGPADLTIAELVDQYRRYAEGYYRRPDGSPSGHLSVVKAAMRFVRKLYGNQLAKEFGPLALRALRERMIGDGLARSYINGQVHRIRLAFKWAASRELIPIEVYQRLLTVEGLRRGRSDAVEPDPIKPVDDAVVAATLRFLNPTLAAMVRIQSLTGMRPGEVCIMRPCDIDRTRDVWVFCPPQHKTAHHAHTRRVSIGPKCQKILKKYLLRSADSYCFSPAEVMAKIREQRHEERTTPLSCGNLPGSNRKRKPAFQPGRFYKRLSYARAIMRACDAADAAAHEEHKDVDLRTRLVPRWHPNQLRHGRATEVRKLFGLEAVAATLGHARLSTAEIYAEKNMALADQVAREVG